MLVIKGNLIIDGTNSHTENLRQAQLGSETSSDLLECDEIVAFADIDSYDISNATILEGDITVTGATADIILVTGDAIVLGGDYATS